MEHNYLRTWMGRLHALIVLPLSLIIFLFAAYQYSLDKEAQWWGLPVMFVGFLLFLRAKWSVIKEGKLFTFGCDPMDQKNAIFYSLGWGMMIAGYFLSFG